MKRDFILNRIIKVMLLVLSMTVGQNALAESSWTVENSNGNSNTFTIKRSEKGYSQKVLYRTVSLSAYAGQHYTAKYGELEFLENEDTKTVTVTEITPNVDSYKYQNGATRQYKLEVTDRAGLLLASATRDMTIGYNVASSGVFDNKSYTIRSSEVTVTEDGYAQSSNPHTVASTQFYTEGTKAYLVYLNAELRMRLEFQAKEVNDGYQYVQILTDNTTGCDTGAGDGNPGTPNVSHYMAGFDIGGKGVDTYYKYSFPVPSVGNDAGATKPWTELSNSVADLKKQKFNTGCRASDGRLILPTGFSTLVVRLNASGSDEDDWKAKDIKAFIQASDATMPTKLSVSAAPGRHAKGNTVYVSVAFSEIVTVTGTPTLTTTSDNHWGSLSYVTGSGTNVLTFSTTIPQDATGNLNVTGYSGTITDLAGNAPSSVTASSLCSLDDDLAYTLSDFQQEDGNYLITCHDDLRGLAGYVNSGNNCSGLTFRQVADIAFAHTTNWNNSSSTENNFTAIGDNDYVFQGTYDGDGHTISGIRIYKGGDKKSDSHQGLFGMVGRGGTVKRVTLADARITGRHNTGGIAGQTFSCTIEDCTVGADVCIHAVQISTKFHGGIVGLNHADLVRRCISRATLTVADASYCNNFGGIVGFNTDCITDCIAEGVVIPDVNGRGAIVGYKSAGTLSRNYYRGCTVAGVANATGVGQGTSESSTETSDPAGACALWAITLGTNVTTNRTPATDPLPGTNNYTYTKGADIAGVPYAIASSVVNLSYNPAAITEGYDVLLTVNKNSSSATVVFTDNCDHTYTIASMPAADITVSSTEIPIIAYIDADGNPQSHACTPIVSGTTGYQTFGRTDGWYVVNSDVTISGNRGVKFLDQQVNIILCDGATLTSNAIGKDNIGLNAQNGSIVIYGQSLGSGTLSASTNANAIKAKSNIDLNGGNVDVASAANTGIIADSIITIRRGNIMAQGRSTGISSIYNNVIILGGNVSAVGDYFGISANNITLGYASVTDRITANNYTCNTLTIADGQTLTNGEGSIISGTYTDDDLLDARSAIDHKTLQPAYSITLPNYFTVTGTTAHQGYAPAGEVVTLHTDAGYTINSASYTPVGGSATTITPVEGVWSFTLPAANTTVSAERSANTYTVHFDANYDNNGIVISGTMDDMAFTYDQAQAITSNTYERTGYTFTGWNTQPDGNGDSYTDGQSVNNLTIELNGVITLYAQWSIIDWTGTGTSENNPYLISFASQLVKLSNDVNGGNKYTGQFIKLGNDIDMNGVVFEGIGSRLNYFEGTFDGDGYTISNVTIDRSNGSDVVGFFGHISEGTVKNLIIDGASITGKNYVGGIIGYSYKTTISNCLVLNTSITVTTGDKCGVYGQSGGSLTLTNNHYHNCTVTIRETTYTTNMGVSSNDCDGVRSIHTLTLPEHVTAASAETVTIGTTTYYASNVTVTLTTDQGFSLSDVTVNGTPATHNQDGTWSFTMPEANTTVSADRNANTYTVHFDANATNTTGTMDDMTFTYDQAKAFTSNTFERTGYTFTGWNTQPDGNGDAYTDGQSVSNLTTEMNGVVTLYAQWSIIDWTGTGTSENDPYLITFASQLVKLSNDVNGGNDYTGKFFKLGNDIDMNGVAFDGIGIDQKTFRGTFDGDGKTISNITINKSNSSVDVGFFGYIFNGTVKNLIIDGASITGKNYVGGIMGYSYQATVSNCLVLNTSITVTNGDKCGVYGFSGGSLILTNNHYNNCTVTIGETTYTTNIGVGESWGRNDRDGVRSVYTLTLPEHVTVASAETVTIGTTTYYASKVTVTLKPDQGFSLSDVTMNGTPATYNQDGTWNFSMPAADATVSATISVPYIDADGQEQQCTNYTLLSSGGQLDDGWYVVRGDITIDEGLNFEQSNIHLILCDGATLTLTNPLGYVVIIGYNLSIYGQRLGTGNIDVTSVSRQSAFRISDAFTINGGNTNVAVCNLGIQGAPTTTCITVGSNFTINGGIVNVNGDEGISSRNITLGWRNTSDRITASSYQVLGGTINVKSGQAFTDGTAVYTGTLTNYEKTAIAGKTLQPCFRITLPEHVVATGVISQNGTTAYALPGAEVSVASDFGFEISPVTYNGSNATANGDGTYTFSMPARSTIVSATVTDLWGIGAGKDGSTANNAYVITTTAGLNLLATQVNGGNDYYGTYFKLGGDIEYDSSVDNNYTAIGTYSNPFGGIFDGNGYTLRGINIQSDESYQGLFGMISSDGTVKNVVVQDADIRGDYQIGAIAGGCEGRLQNCLVIGTTVSGNYNVDMICDSYGYWYLVADNCHYINCRNSTWSSGTNSSDLYTFNAGDDVLWSINSYDKGIEYNGVLYFPLRANVSLDLSYTGQVPDGDVLVFKTTEGELTKTDNSYTLVIYGNATINAFMGKPNINYLDSIGTAQVCPAAVPITDHEGDLVYESGGWFVVNGQVTVNGMISFEEDAHIILCDGATLTAHAIVSGYDALSIYAQSSGDDMGCINSGIFVDERFTINGGKITTNNTYVYDLDGIGLYAEDIVIYSGIINTMGDDIVCEDLMIGWRNTTDRVTAGGYRCYHFFINPGQAMTDGDNLYYGFLSLTQMDELTGKALMPCLISNITESEGITDAIAANIAGKTVSFSRDYTDGCATTICLPFVISGAYGGDFYKFVDVSYSDFWGWVATMEELETDNQGNLVTPTEAGKPYLFEPYFTGTFSFTGKVPDDVSSVAGATTNGNWTFHGTYSRLDYGDEGFSGTVFGFAATDGKAADGVTDVEEGQFVKAANGAYILPFRAYLTYSGSNNALRSPGRDGAGIPAIPNRIKVRLVRGNGITTAIGTMDMETGEVTIDQWFYLNGQPVEGAPTAPGMYLNSDGKKVMITE